VDVGITFRARSGRHFFNLQEKFEYLRVSVRAYRLRALE
jgi:hypothetical protein